MTSTRSTKSLARHFKNWLDGYLEYTRYSEAPTPLHFWTGVSTIGGALRRRVWIDELQFQWTPNFYIVFVGPPGVITKSTSIRLGADLLREIDGVHFGPNSLTWQALAVALEEAFEEVPLPLIADEDTPRTLPMSCITCSIKEFGTFIDPSDRKLIDVFTDLWDGQLETWEHSTKTQGKTKVQNPWINIISAVTPAWLKKNMPDEMIGGGLTSRIIFVFGDKKRELIPYPSELIKTDNWLQDRQHLIDDLREIATLVGEYKLTPEAIEFGSDWYRNKLWGERPTKLASDRFDGYLSRKQTHVHKLAIVLAAAQRDELVITKRDLELSIRIITSLEDSMLVVFQSIGVSETSRYLVEIIAYLKVLKRIDKRTLWRECYSVMTSQQFADALEGGVRAGYIRIVNHGGVEGDIIYITPDGLALTKGKKDDVDITDDDDATG